MKYLFKNFATTFFKSNRHVVTSLFVAAFIAYAFMLNSPFKTLDDPSLIINNPNIRSFSNIGKIFCSPILGKGLFYRPLLVFYYMVIYRVFGLNPFFFNLMNLLVHGGVSLSIFFLVNDITESRKTGFFVSLLFAIHPIHWEAVSMNLADTLLCAFFYVNSFYFFWRYSEKNRPVLQYILSLIFFSLALLSKEYAVTLPFVVLSYYIFLRTRSAERKKNIAFISQRILPFFGILLAYFFLRQSLGITRVFYWASFKNIILALATFSKFIIINLRLAIAPTDLRFERITPIFWHFLDAKVIGALFFFFAGIFWLIKNIKKLNPKAIFFLSWFLITLLPSSQIIPISIQKGYLSIAERHMYLASLGTFTLLVLLFQAFYGWVIHRRSASQKIIVAAVIGWFVFLVLITFAQSIRTRNKIAVYWQSLQYDTDNTRVRYTLGIEYANRGLFAKAQKEFETILEFDPQNVKARIALGKILCDQGRCAEGISEYKKIQDPGEFKELLENNLRRSYQLLNKE